MAIINGTLLFVTVLPYSFLIVFTVLSTVARAETGPGRWPTSIHPCCLHVDDS